MTEVEQMTLPPRPPLFNPALEPPKSLMPKRGPNKCEFLCTVDWYFSPWSERSADYYLQSRRNWWLLRSWEEDEGWKLCAAAPKRGVSAKEAAVHLMIYNWTLEVSFFDIERFHSVNSEGLLDFEEIHAIADKAWKDKGK
ncbi:MAG: hypothetical protein QF492_09680 [Candidatus Krumholzibacteria bacterium]|jgi:hypothetical protein|nr:hypothetical protein [Candidatus Krumholzibacteria bacterium]MDP6670156.1 hypothetical protein [Candidatus Krumholzibacteria bacterium]MDP6797115.1 hypothetical protein [Candidatus Krumholzibacteria bacterium]MDP7022432.1 hypothetical protein [Candidatus Krumholzibacteria bacterium]